MVEAKLGSYLGVPIPTMPITHSDLMAITIPSDADHRRSEATLGCSYHAEVIGRDRQQIGTLIGIAGIRIRRFVELHRRG